MIKNPIKIAILHCLSKKIDEAYQKWDKHAKVAMEINFQIIVNDAKAPKVEKISLDECNFEKQSFLNHEFIQFLIQNIRKELYL